MGATWHIYVVRTGSARHCARISRRRRRDRIQYPVPDPAARRGHGRRRDSPARARLRGGPSLLYLTHRHRIDAVAAACKRWQPLLVVVPVYRNEEMIPISSRRRDITTPTTGRVRLVATEVRSALATLLEALAAHGLTAKLLEMSRNRRVRGDSRSLSEASGPYFAVMAADCKSRRASVQFFGLERMLRVCMVRAARAIRRRGSHRPLRRRIAGSPRRCAGWRRCLG